MCLLSRKRLKNIEEALNEIKSERVNQLQIDSDELKQIKELLSYIRLTVKKVVPMQDGTVKVIYNAPSLIVNGSERNNMFYAINMLELVSYEDMAKIQEVINDLGE